MIAITGIYFIGIFIYFVMAGITDDFGAESRADRETVSMFALMWPLALIVISLFYLVSYFGRFARAVGRGILDWYKKD